MTSSHNNTTNTKTIFGEKDFDKLPEQRPWDHAIEVNPWFKTYRLQDISAFPTGTGVITGIIEET